jgi:hypothetical protein
VLTDDWNRELELCSWKEAPPPFCTEVLSIYVSMLGRFWLQESVLQRVYFLIMQGDNIFRSDFHVFKASAPRGHTDRPTDPDTDFAGSVMLAVLTGHELCCVLQQHQAPLAVPCSDVPDCGFVILTCCTVIRSSGHVEVQNGLSNLQGVFILWHTWC